MSDLQRDKFEKHCALWRYDMEVDENDFFVNATTQRAWNIWVASWQDAIDSVVVELPPVFDAAAYDATYYEYAYSQSGIYDALDKAGVKYER